DQKPHQEEREIVARAQVEYVAPGEDDDGLIRRPDISWQEQVSDDPFSSVSSGEADSFFSPAIGGVVDRLDDRLQVGLVIRIKAFECLEEVVRNRGLFSMIPLLDVDGIRRLRGNPFISGEAKTVVRGSIEGRQSDGDAHDICGLAPRPAEDEALVAGRVPAPLPRV